jgi:tRNA-modifying protein YgfZ
MTKSAAWLGDRGIVRVFGPDAASFLQGVVTNDVEKLMPSEARYAALLTPQGKILFDFLVVRLPAEAGFALDCAATHAADLVKRLGFYKLRAKVSVVDESENEAVLAFWGEEPENDPGAIVYADPRAAGLGFRVLLPRAKAMAIGEGSQEEYDALRIKHGVPQGGLDFAYGDTFPHDANLDLINGVDFQKGCYVGQEVVSRMQHRGGVRKRVVRVRAEGNPPPAGTPILDGQLPVGSLGGASGHEALALVRIDRVEDARTAGRPFTAERVALTFV